MLRYTILTFFLVSSFTAKAGRNDSIWNLHYKTVRGWHFSAGYTRNTFNNFSVDIGRYHHDVHIGYYRAFMPPPLIHYGVGFDAIKGKNTTAFAVRAYYQREFFMIFGYRLDLLNYIEDKEYCTKLRTSVGLSFEKWDLHYNYTFDIYNKDLLKQRHGITLRINFNPLLRKQSAKIGSMPGVHDAH